MQGLWKLGDGLRDGHMKPEGPVECGCADLGPRRDVSAPKEGWKLSTDRAGQVSCV